MAGKLKTFQNFKKSLCNTAADVTKGKKNRGNSNLEGQILKGNAPFLGVVPGHEPVFVA